MSESIQIIERHKRRRNQVRGHHQRPGTPPRQCAAGTGKAWWTPMVRPMASAEELMGTMNARLAAFLQMARLRRQRDNKQLPVFMMPKGQRR